LNDSNQRTFLFLQHLAADLSSGKITFTTFADATIKVRMALNNPRLTANELAATIVAEPLLPVKLLRLANSAAINPGGNRINDIKTAVVRVGYTTIRSLAINLALSQLTHMKALEPFADEARAILHHSADVAALAYVIARRMTRINCDEALFAGLVHDIGRFYLLSRVTKYPELNEEHAEVAGLVDAWHAAAGHAILDSLSVPDAILDAVNRHEDDVAHVPPRDLADVLNIANRISHSPNPLNKGSPIPGDLIPFYAPAVFDVVNTSGRELLELATALRS
jgi:putative nucleotidyltransferase with HDIG domain